MFEVFKQITNMTPPFNMIVLIVLICTFAGVVTSIAKEIRKYACRRQELDFKRELLEQGMSGDEIERVVNARQKD